MKYIFSLIILGIGIWLTITYSNWQVFLGVFLLLWANNIELEGRFGGNKDEK